MKKGEKAEKTQWAQLQSRRRRGRQLLIVAADIVTIVLAYIVGLWARYEFRALHIPKEQMLGLLYVIPTAVILTVVIYLILHLYHSIWSYASVAEARRIIDAYLILMPLLILVNRIGWQKLPWSSMFMAYTLSGAACFGIRFGYRYVHYLIQDNEARRRFGREKRRILLVGAGRAAREVLLEIAESGDPTRRIEVIVDDNAAKHGRYLEGVPIEGSRYDIPALVEKYRISDIVYAITTASPEDRYEILCICKDTGCHVQTVPGIMQVLDGDMTLSTLQEVKTIDLLGRDEIRVNTDEIRSFLRGKTILVTGGGGSIGSELCRQIAKAEPKKLIVFDIYENSAYELEQELRRDYPKLSFDTEIGSVRNTNRVNSILAKYHPDIIFHAAAHKHVPLMEESPNEAIKNNVMGTYKLAKAACAAKVGRFVLISTDKAVNPTNIMGASKRICEMVIQMMDRECPDTRFSAVRFGNVLGSNGSVIPLFKKQIEQGGPVTVTDPNIIRYFMTIPEAVSLVLQAGCYAKGGEIFVLDMGKPVRIDDMARNLIRLSGHTPDVDIKIVYTGLRPGEKLYEELLMDEEGLEKTANDSIYIAKPIEMDDEVFKRQLALLGERSRQEDPDIRKLVSEIVPTYKIGGVKTDTSGNV